MNCGISKIAHLIFLCLIIFILLPPKWNSTPEFPLAGGDISILSQCYSCMDSWQIPPVQRRCCQSIRCPQDLMTVSPAFKASNGGLPVVLLSETGHVTWKSVSKSAAPCSVPRTLQMQSSIHVSLFSGADTLAGPALVLKLHISQGDLLLSRAVQMLNDAEFRSPRGCNLQTPPLLRLWKSVTTRGTWSSHIKCQADTLFPTERRIHPGHQNFTCRSKSGFRRLDLGPLCSQSIMTQVTVGGPQNPWTLPQARRS